MSPTFENGLSRSWTVGILSRERREQEVGHYMNYGLCVGTIYDVICNYVRKIYARLSWCHLCLQYFHVHLQTMSTLHQHLDHQLPFQRRTDEQAEAPTWLGIYTT